MNTTPEYLQDSCIFLSPAGSELATAYDYAGDIRWCLNIKCVFDMKRLKNGHVLMGTDRLVSMPYYMSGMYETSPCGKIYHEYRVPGGSHHDAFEMPDGNLLCLTERSHLSYRRRYVRPLRQGNWGNHKNLGLQVFPETRAGKERKLV